MKKRGREELEYAEQILGVDIVDILPMHQEWYGFLLPEVGVNLCEDAYWCPFGSIYIQTPWLFTMIGWMF